MTLDSKPLQGRLVRLESLAPAHRGGLRGACAADPEMLKLGAHEDGTLRAARITWTGRVRDTVVFSILASEWPKIREGLDARLTLINPEP
jgi:hypothetical protein